MEGDAATLTFDVDWLASKNNTTTTHIPKGGKRTGWEKDKVKREIKNGRKGQDKEPQ